MKDQIARIKQALDAAAELAVEHGLSVEEFMPAAWTAFVKRSPQLLERLEREHVLAQLDAMRERGLIAQA